MSERLRPKTVEDLQLLIGHSIGPTKWLDVSQPKIDAFAEVTGDEQWIHVDPERAAAGPFGATIAHGLFTLALGPLLTEELMDFSGFAHSLNYGYQKVRFPAPLLIGSRLRMSLRVADISSVEGGIQVTIVQTYEREGGQKPVCVAESLARLVAAEEAPA